MNIWFLLENQLPINVSDLEDLEQRNRLGDTPLVVAAEKGRQEVIRQLLEQGAQVNAQAGEGRTALQRAALNGYVPIVQLLLRAGAELDLQDSEDQTALGYAAAAGNNHILELLFQAGADVNLPLGAYSPLDRAIEAYLYQQTIEGDPERWRQTINFLLENGAEIGPTAVEKVIHGLDEEDLVATEGSYELLKEFADRWVDLSAYDLTDFWAIYPRDEPNDLDGQGRTNLMLAASAGLEYKIREYLQRPNLNLDAEDLDGNTALHYAAQHDQGNIFDLLVEAGANPQLENIAGALAEELFP